MNSEFDPEAHDRRMAEFFNNGYYGIDEGDTKPQFADIDEELNIEDWDNFDKNRIQLDNEDDNSDSYEPHCEDDEFNMDCDFDPREQKKQELQKELIDITKGGRKRKKKVSKLAALIKKDKPVYDPKNWESYEEYLDEYYKLDFEDIVGNQPYRSNYTECVPNDFGLTVEEILTASNKELNQWASLKKRTMQNRPENAEQNDEEKYNRMCNNTTLKKKIFKSIYDDNEGDDSASEDVGKVGETSSLEKTAAVEETVPVTNAKKKKKRSKKKEKYNAQNLPQT